MLDNNQKSDLVFEIEEAIPVKKDKSELENNDIRQVVMEAITEEENKRKEKEKEVAVQ